MDALRIASRLDANSVRGYAWLVAAFNLGTLAYLLATSRNGTDTFGHLLGSDFLSFWAAGKLLATGQSPYDVAAHLAVMKDFAPSLDGYPAYFYPPMFLLACYPLGLLPYFPALALWLVTTGALFIAAANYWAKRLGLKLPVWLWVAAFPPILITITHGQTSFLLAALLGSSLLLTRDRPWIAGLLLGLATFKPQFGLLVPVAVLLTGNLRVAVAAVVSTTALATATTLAFGPEVWGDWYALTAQARSSMASGNIGYGKMVSVFAAIRLIGSPESLAYLLQALVTGVVVVAVASVSWRKTWTIGLAALVLAGAPLATPFALDYDIVLLAFPLIYLAGTGYRDWEKAASASVFLAPIFSRPLALEFEVPIMPVVLGFFFWVLWRRLRVQEST